MAKAQPVRLIYLGAMVETAWDADGTPTRHEPERWFWGVPARDIDAAEFEMLGFDIDRIKELIAGDDPLYVAEYEEGQGADKSIDEMTVDELRSLAAERGIEGRSSMNKADLVLALSSGQGGATDNAQGDQEGGEGSSSDTIVGNDEP